MCLYVGVCLCGVGLLFNMGTVLSLNRDSLHVI